MNQIKSLAKKNFFKYEHLFKKLTSKVIYDLNKDILDKQQKKILISYLSEQFLFGLDKKLSHTNYLENSLLIKYFINNNYCIDIIDCNDENFLPKENYYDIILGFGFPFRKAIKSNKNAFKILYLTESSPKFSFKMESKRIEYYKIRNKNNKKIPLTRTGTYYKDEDLDLADYFLLIGSSITLNTYLENYTLDKNRFHLINPTGLYNNNFNIKIKKLEKNYNFLWFGSRGVIHKGLDLLSDIFCQKKEYNLYAYGVNLNEYKYLRKADNIYLNQKIDVFSDSFLNLTDNINFAILPSCSEGLSTSVITCMMHGLIPIITKETGVILPENTGFYIEEISLEYISKLLDDVSSLSLEEIKCRRENSYLYAHDNYNLINYNSNIIQILNDIL